MRAAATWVIGTLTIIALALGAIASDHSPAIPRISVAPTLVRPEPVSAVSTLSPTTSTTIDREAVLTLQRAEVLEAVAARVRWVTAAEASARTVRVALPRRSGKALSLASVAVTAPPLIAPGAPEPDYHGLADWPLWHAVGVCEQSGGGPDGIAWHGSPAGGEPGSGYPGGLGISRAAWDDARGAAGVNVTNGADATPYQQILVARVIRARFGIRAWAQGTIACMARRFGISG